MFGIELGIEKTRGETLVGFFLNAYVVQILIFFVVEVNAILENESQPRKFKKNATSLFNEI